MHLIIQTLDSLVHGTKHFLGMLIAGIISLVVLLTATAIATTALVEIMQTQQFVNDWVQNASHM